MNAIVYITKAHYQKHNETASTQKDEYEVTHSTVSSLNKFYLNKMYEYDSEL